jgi:hypothetical protein
MACLTTTQLRRGLPLPAAVYGRNRDRPENHGVPGSNPGLALLFYNVLQVKRREKNEAPTLAGASRRLRDSYR